MHPLNADGSEQRAGRRGHGSAVKVGCAAVAPFDARRMIPQQRGKRPVFRDADGGGNRAFGLDLQALSCYDLSTIPGTEGSPGTHRPFSIRSERYPSRSPEHFRLPGPGKKGFWDDWATRYGSTVSSVKQEAGSDSDYVFEVRSDLGDAGNHVR